MWSLREFVLHNSYYGQFKRLEWSIARALYKAAVEIGKYMMCVLVLGAGYQGAVIAEMLSVNSYVYQVTVIDVDNSKLRQ